MKQQSNRIVYIALFLVIIWSGYVVWEWQVAKWAATQTGAVIRVDLLFIIPILLATTFYTVYQFYKTKNK